MSTRKRRSIKDNVKFMLIFLIPILILDFVISYSSIRIVREQSRDYLDSVTNMYIDQINQNFSSINHFMGWEVINDKAIREMAKNKLATDYQYSELYQEVYSRFSEYQISYGDEYNFFIYLEEHGYYHNISRMSYDYAQYQLLREQVISIIKQNNLKQSNPKFYYSRWNAVSVGKTTHLVNIVPYQNVYIICAIAEDELLKPLRQLNLGKNGFVSLVNDSDIIGSSSASTEKLTSKTIIQHEFSLSKFSFQIVIDHFGRFEMIVVAQFLIILLLFIAVGIICLIILYIKRNILKPIQQFSDNLKSVYEDSEPFDLGSSRIIELEQANEQFKNLMRQIKRLKIDVYEKELEKQQIQMDYLSLQIKPHFLLNCLTSIYSMAQVQLYEEIEQFVLFTSNYCRYLFQSNSSFTRLADEAQHAWEYLNIQKIILGSALEFSINRDETLSDAKIPPLVILTFIENVMKHGLSLNKKNNVTLTIQPAAMDRQYVEIDITDTGEGFPPDILNRLQGRQPLHNEKGKHMGIFITMQRLGKAYHEDYDIRFSNMENGGAHITIIIPFLHFIEE